MALKTKDGMVRSEPVCFTRDSCAMGITFELKARTALFAPYAFLSHAQRIQQDQIIFHYSFGVVRLIGHHLETIFSLLKQHNLDFARLSEANDRCRDEIEVARIVFENIPADAVGSEL